MYQRAYGLDRLKATLAGDDAAAQNGGLLYVEIDGAGQIRERVGLTIFDALLNQVGAFIASHIEAKDVAARYGDTSFILLCHSGDDAALAKLSADLHDRTSPEVLDHEGKTPTVSLGFGIRPFAAGLGERRRHAQCG